jgi:S-adenosyl-L-methionine hydrolase (adenosine-forming)
LKKPGLISIRERKLKKVPEKIKNKIIALLTDFGLKDWYVASMKGIIKGISPHSSIIDISHEISPQDIYAASFVLESCYRDFPLDTVFCCVVDPGVGTGRECLICTDGCYYFIAPDNGLLTGVMAAAKKWRAYYISAQGLLHNGTGCTFDGRDVFAPAAAHIAESIPMEKFGRPCNRICLIEDYGKNRIEDSILKGKVIYTDHFGNIFTDIKKSILTENHDLIASIVVIGKISIQGILRSYEDVKKGSPLAYWGSTGNLEIAVNQANAAEKLNIKKGDQVELHFKKC